jgi:hypothetical protein
MDKLPSDPADHAENFANRYCEPLDRYCAIQMEELGIPEEKIRERDLRPSINMVCI